VRLLLAGRVAASPWMNPARWEAAPPTGAPADAASAAWRRDHYETVLAVGPERVAAAERARAAVLAYRIFPPETLIAALPDLTARPGATIVQGFRLGPLGLIAAVRVLTVFDRERDGLRRTGFSYVTLAGHPERGAMTFAVVEDADVARFEMDAISRPGHWLTRLGAPLARRLQRATSEAALDRLRRVARGEE
jgi:uncharacterized protein (UPF0548 family)